MPVPEVAHHQRYAPAQRGQINAVAILARCYVKELKELRMLRAMGWKDQNMDEHFASQRHRSDTAPVQAQQAWFKGMLCISRELDAAAGFIPTSEPLEFLDIGCAPGGFSTHILQTNPDARGVGISLSESQGGHPLLLSWEYTSRYEYLEQDLLEYDLSPHPITSPTPSPALRPLPDAFLGRFQIVLSDGHPLRTYHSPHDAINTLVAPHEHSGSLLIAQLIVALAAVQAGGTVLLKLMHIEGSPAAQLIYLLDAISDTLIVHKPGTMHRNRASFYAVAKGVGGTEERAALKEWYIAGLRALWLELRTGGPAGGGRRLVDGDLDFVATPEVILDIDGYLERLVELGRPVWATQVQGLRGFFEKKGIQGFPVIAGST
ncbi:uncharacterized protein TRAVEDRAFT_48024 [Trametes versicolor FP-101664 SS1]|uniref:uncharacterized protein n=1 Tax=Trametes versicolor (strain FP-101664) TaxID=717944 RepID=UPI0004621251|nr:uncharacterized protein TRAVEDRAFT_48024 [Trametes versicolor FP-101664 SS1]EIW58881.1 hypothetical protein TRAVEDRAFT_48024 [Trametes versicolor FP-101664 SS1]